MKKLFLSLLTFFRKDDVQPRKSGRKKNSPVVQINLNGYKLMEYSNVNVASEFTGINITSIYKVCNNQRHTAGGYKWEYKK